MSDVELAKRMIEGLAPKWGPAPEGAKCTKCGSDRIERSRIPLGGPFAGSVRCNACGFIESVYSHVGKTCISVEPLGEPR